MNAFFFQRLLALGCDRPLFGGEAVQLRLEPGGDKPTVVFCTTENDVERISEALKAGADEYMMKPFDGDILESKLSETGLV